MSSLPEIVQNEARRGSTNLRAIFEVNSSNVFTFVYANQIFVDFHSVLGFEITADDVLGKSLRQYFRKYLGFSNQEIESRMLTAVQAIDSKAPYSFMEVSDWPDSSQMVLDTTWTPLFANERTFVVWDSKEYNASD